MSLSNIWLWLQRKRFNKRVLQLHCLRTASFADRTFYGIKEITNLSPKLEQQKQNKQPQGPSGLKPGWHNSSSHQPINPWQGEGLFSACRKLQPILQSARLVGPACCASQFVCPLPRSTRVVPGVRHEWCLQGLGPALQNRQFGPITVAMTPEQQLSTFNASGARALNHAASQAAM